MSVERRHRMRTDAALLRRFRGGDESAFGALHARYADGVRSYAAYMLRGSAHDPDDAAQDVFLRAYQALRRDEREIDVRPWLFRVAHNRCIDALRRPVGDELGEDTFGAASVDPAAAIEARESMRALLRDIGALTDGQRSALLLRELGGLSHEAVGDALGISTTSSRMLVHRARLALTDAAEARDTTCREVRDRVVVAADGGDRLARRDRRHVAACAECRAFHRAHARVERELSLLAPGGLGGFGLWQLFGGGAAGAGSGVAAKVTVGACCALLAGGGAVVGVREATTARPTHRPAPRTAERVVVHPATAPARRATVTRARAVVPAPARAVAVAVPRRPTTTPRPATPRHTPEPPARVDPAHSVDLATLDHAPSPEPARATTIDLADLAGG